MGKFFIWGSVAHEGQLFGLLSQIFGSLAAFGVGLMALSGLALWWRRRPVEKRKMTPSPRAASPGLCRHIGACGDVAAPRRDDRFRLPARSPVFTFLPSALVPIRLCAGSDADVPVALRRKPCRNNGGESDRRCVLHADRVTLGSGQFELSRESWYGRSVRVAADLRAAVFGAA